MRVIEQNKYAELKVTKLISGNLCIEQYDFDNDSSEINIDKQGAKQLIEVLKEFIGEKTDVTKSHENEAYLLNKLG